MIIYVKNSILFLYYAILCFLMLTKNIVFVKSVFFYFFPVMMVYYMCMLHPRIHMMYIYYVMEKKYVRWKQVWQFFFHFAMYLHDDNMYISLGSLLYLFLYKELYFVLSFAESRLGKIEESIHEKIPEYRIAHLHLNVFKEDMDNRFHESCFNTNRLYVLESTGESRKTQLGISNYRDVRRKDKPPRDMGDEEQVMYIASSNETTFLENRQYFIFYPVAILGILLLFTMVGSTNPLATYFNLSLILSDLLSYMFMRSQRHDVSVDVNYAVSALLFAQLHYSNIPSP